MMVPTDEDVMPMMMAAMDENDAVMTVIAPMPGAVIIRRVLLLDRFARRCSHQGAGGCRQQESHRNNCRCRDGGKTESTHVCLLAFPLWLRWSGYHNDDAD